MNLYQALSPEARKAVALLLGFGREVDVEGPGAAGFRNALRDIPVDSIKGTLTIGKAFRAYLKQIAKR